MVTVPNNEIAAWALIDTGTEEPPGLLLTKSRLNNTFRSKSCLPRAI